MGDKKSLENSYPQTYVITSAQGTQSPYSARHYGKDSSKGKVTWEEYRVPEEVTKGRDLDFEK